jgi:hypothetical protein
MAVTPLDSMPALARHVPALKSPGYRSVESFLSAARVANPEMSAFWENMPP